MFRPNPARLREREGGHTKSAWRIARDARNTRYQIKFSSRLFLS
jgi:hypothetical protein